MDYPQASQPAAARKFQDLVQRYHRADAQYAAVEKELSEIKREMSSFLKSSHLDRCSALVRIPGIEHLATGFQVTPSHNYVYTVESREHGEVSITGSLLLEPGKQ